MKRLYLIGILLLLWAQGVQAQERAAVLLESQRGEYFHLAIGGRMINPVASNRVAVGDLPPGRHRLDIKVLGRWRRVQHITAEVVLAAGYESVFVLEPLGRGRHLVLRKAEEVPLAQPAPPTDTYSSCQYVMAEPEVDRTLRFMKEEGFDDQRLEIAKSEIKLTGGIMTEDLYRLMRALAFDDRRVALAKFAYDYVCDRQRFSRVFDAFEFSGGRRELQDFLYKK